jgi:isopenicillin-N epimerase
VPVDVRGLGAAYWTGNGHKWLCGPKGAGMLVVREDRRAGIAPLVTSHGRNDLRQERPLLWREFDWQGTTNPTAFLCLPEAIRLIGGLRPGSWPAHMDANRALAVEARSMLNQRLGLEPIAPESMLGSMAAIRLPTPLEEDAANEIARSLAEVERIEVPLVSYPVRAAREAVAGAEATLLRVSAQAYNEPADYDRLADALQARGLGSQAGAAAGSGIVAG